MCGMLKTKIFVDGNCIVCDTEVAHYKRIAPEIFDIVDISSADFSATAYGLTTEAVNREMHVLTPEGEIKKGVDAFSHIWSRLPKYEWASLWIKKPLIYPLAKLGYRAFAANRHLLPKKKVKSL